MAINFANNSSLANITSLPASISGGGLTLVSSQTASASASLEFSMDSSYDSYVFKFINCHPSNDGVYLNFQASTNGGSSYGVTLTSTFFRSLHNEADDSTNLEYRTARDLAQSTSFQNLTEATGNDNDQSCSGILTIFAPSSTIFVKHWLSTNNTYHNNDFSMNVNSAGYFNTTSAITNLKFQFSSGTIDDGIIKMYGVA
jgi:hypothetical protein